MNDPRPDRLQRCARQSDCDARAAIASRFVGCAQVQSAGREPTQEEDSKAVAFSAAVRMGALPHSGEATQMEQMQWHMASRARVADF